METISKTNGPIKKYPIKLKEKYQLLVKKLRNRFRSILYGNKTAVAACVRKNQTGCYCYYYYFIVLFIIPSTLIRGPQPTMLMQVKDLNARHFWCDNHRKLFISL